MRRMEQEAKLRPGVGREILVCPACRLCGVGRAHPGCQGPPQPARCGRVHNSSLSLFFSVQSVILRPLRGCLGYMAAPLACASALRASRLRFMYSRYQQASATESTKSSWSASRQWL
jgi:hypothetical protein